MSNHTTNASAPGLGGSFTEATSVTRKPWCSPMLKDVGHVGDVLQGGGGKLSPVTNDSGDMRKPKGTE